MYYNKPLYFSSVCLKILAHMARSIPTRIDLPATSVSPIDPPLHSLRIHSLQPCPSCSTQLHLRQSTSCAAKTTTLRTYVRNVILWPGGPRCIEAVWLYVMAPKRCSAVKISLKAKFQVQGRCAYEWEEVSMSLIRLLVSRFLGTRNASFALRVGLGDGHLRNMIRVQGIARSR